MICSFGAGGFGLSKRVDLMRGLPTALRSVAIAAVSGSTGRAKVIYLDQVVDIRGRGFRYASSQCKRTGAIGITDTGDPRFAEPSTWANAPWHRGTGVGVPSVPAQTVVRLISW